MAWFYTEPFFLAVTDLIVRFADNQNILL